MRHPNLWHRAGLPWPGAASRAASGSCGDPRRPPADESQNTLDDSTGTFTGSTIQLYYDPRSDYGNSNQDQRHIFSSSIVYKLPFGRGQRFGCNVSRSMDWLIGGWQMNVIGFVCQRQALDLSTSIAQPANRLDLIGPSLIQRAFRALGSTHASFRILAFLQCAHRPVRRWYGTGSGPWDAISFTDRATGRWTSAHRRTCT